MVHSIFKLSLVEASGEYLSFYLSLLFQEGKFSILLTLAAQAVFLYPTLASGETLAPSSVSARE